jgi:hypothetical protein
VPLPSGDFLLGGVESDQPCTATQQAGEPVSLGVALQEVAEMSVDPRDLGLTGENWMYESAFVDNAEYGLEWPDGCDAAQRLGRVTGHSQSVTDYALMQDGSAAPQVMTQVHLFQTGQGAQAYLSWAPLGTPWPCVFCLNVTGASPAAGSTSVEPLTDLGPDAVVVRSVAAEGTREVVLVREGAVVGEATVISPPDARPAVAVEDVGTRLADQIRAVRPTGQPYDVMQVMSAPAPLAAWGPDYAALEWDIGYAGGRDNWEFVEMSMDPTGAAADLETLSRLAGFQANYSGPPWAATAITVFPDADHARAALADVVADRLAGIAGLASPATRFDVPGIDGAVGLSLYTSGDGGSQLSTEVYFAHGAALARAYLVEPAASGAAAESREQQAVVAVAQQWVPRLDRVLG